MNLAIYSLQVALVVAAAAIAVRFFRPGRACARLTYWRAVVVLLLLLPVLPFPRAPYRVARNTGVTSSGVVDARVSAAAPASWAASLIEWLPWIVLAGAAARGGWLALGLVRLARLRRAGEFAVPNDDVRVLQAMLAPNAELRLCEEVMQPVTFGYRRPVICLPPALASLPTGVQRAIVCHELLHVAQRDWLWTLAEELIRTVFWFHPAMRWAVGQVQSNREQAIDGRALEITGARAPYIQALAAFADAPVFAPATPFTRRHEVVVRIKAISQEVHMSRLRLAVNAVALAGVMIGSAWGIAATVPLQATSAQTAQGSASAADRKVAHRTNAEYPVDALAKGVAAAVTVTLTVSPAGDVVAVSDPKWQLTIGSDSNIGDEASYWASKPWLPFVRAAEAAARQWKFEPAATETTCKIDFGFRTRKKDRHDAAPSASVASTRPGEPTSLPKADAPLRVGGVIKPPRKIVDAKPVYPEDARDGAVEGVVVLDLTIAKDGTVSNAVVRRSIPLLDQAAIDAVRQWRFEPTLLNGAPVEIVMTVTINFSLQ